MKNFNTSAKLLAGAVLVASVGAAGAMNIVQNPSFELGNFDSLGGIGISGVTGVGGPGRTNQIMNWTVTNGSLIWLQNGYAGNTGPLMADTGVRFLDLTALTADPLAYASINQVLNTTINTVYELKFSVGSSNAINGAPFSNTIIDVTAGSFFQSVNIGLPTQPNRWDPITVQFTSDAVLTNLSLTFKGIQGDAYIGLDSVSVTAVPEPTSIAMLFAGLAAVGTVVARRRGQNS